MAVQALVLTCRRGFQCILRQDAFLPSGEVSEFMHKLK